MAGLLAWRLDHLAALRALAIGQMCRPFGRLSIEHAARIPGLPDMTASVSCAMAYVSMPVIPAIDEDD